MATLNLAHVRIGWMNFEGRNEKGYNRNLDRSFHIFFDDLQLAQQLADEGYGVQFPDPNEPVVDGALPKQPRLKVVVSNGQELNFGVKVFLRDEPGAPAVQIDPAMFPKLDNYRIDYADIVINPYEWEWDGKTGVKAFLKTAYLNLYQDDTDEFARQYGVGE